VSIAAAEKKVSFRPYVFSVRDVFSAQAVGLGLVMLFIGLLVVPPLYWLVRTSLTTFSLTGGPVHLTSQYFRQALLEGDRIRFFFNSLLFAATSSVGAAVLGTTLAWLVERTDVPLKWLPPNLAFVLFAVPGILKVTGWILLLNRQNGFLSVILAAFIPRDLIPDIYGLGGMIFMQALLWTPVSFLLMATAFHNMDPSLEEAARASGASGWVVTWRVTLRLALPSLLTVFLLCFIEGLTALDVPLFLGMPVSVYTVTSAVYRTISTSRVPDFGMPSAMGIALMAVVAVIILMYQRAVRRSSSFQTVTGKAFRPRQTSLGARRPIGTALVVILCLLLAAPIFSLIWASFLERLVHPLAIREAMGLLTLRHYVEAVTDEGLRQSVVNTLFIGMASATGVAVLALAVAWFLVRGRYKAVRLLDLLASFPLVFPGILMAQGVLLTHLRTPILPVYGTIWILVLAYVPLFLPFGIRYVHAGLLSIHQELEESGSASGAPWWQVIGRITIPLLRPALVSAWLFTFLISIRELNAAIILYGPRSEVVAASLFDKWNEGSVGLLSSFGMLIAVGAAALGLIVRRVAGRLGM
jgi:iron(III) transport system permease protein